MGKCLVRKDLRLHDHAALSAALRQWVPEVAHLSKKEIHRPNLDTAPDYGAPIVNHDGGKRFMTLAVKYVKK